MKKLALAAIIAGTTTIGIAGYAVAESHGGKGQMIQKMDTDGDGNITKAEVDALKAARFGEADANGDGGLSMAELETFREAEKARRMAEHKQRMFDRLDKDDNGVISVDEFDSRGGSMFDRVDANDDDVISADEIEAMKEHRGKRGGWRHRGDRD